MSIIKRQTILSTFYSYLGVFVGLLTQGYILPNFFEAQQIGLMRILLAWMYIICQIASLGFNHAGTKYFSFFRNDANKHNGYLNLGLKINLLGLVACIFCLYIFKNQIISNQIGSNTSDSLLFNQYFYVLVPISVATVLFNLFDNYAKGLYNTVAGSFYAQFLQRFFLFLAVIVFALNWVDFKQFMCLWMIAIMSPTIFMIIKSINLGNFSLKYSSAFATSVIKIDFRNFALFSVVTGLSSMIIMQLDTIMVNNYLGLAQTGIYSVCLLFSSVMGMSYLAVLKASSALVITALDDKDISKVEQIYKKSSITLYLFGLFTLLLVWINLDFLFGFIKPEYAVGKIALILIGVGKLYDLLHGINGLILSNSKYYKIDSLILISFVLVLYFLNHWLIPSYGLNGAAMAALCAVLYYNSLRTILVWKYFKIQPFGWSQLKATLLFTAILLMILNLPVDSNPWITMFYKSVIASFLFISLVYLLRLSSDFNSILNNFLKKI